MSHTAVADTPYDALETRPPAQREASLLYSLPALIAHAQANAPAMTEQLQGLDVSTLTTRAALARLPVTRKHELLERQGAQRERDVFGGFAATGWGAERAASQRALRVFASPGPIYEPEGPRADYWRMARSLHAAGFRAGDLLHNGFSYHFTPAGSMTESGAHALGCSVFPAGTGQTEQQVQAMQHLQPAGYAGTPSFLKIILDKAAESGIALPSLTKALVSGEAFPPSLRQALTAHGVQALQCYATADVGLIAYETMAREGLIVDESVILEIVRPGTGDPLPDGEVGEVVVTTLNPDYPLIRFGTGDLSAVLPGPCPTGRSNTRIKGWMGRADQRTKVRGMFVDPAQVADVLRRFPEIGKARLIVAGETGQDTMSLQIEIAEAPEGLAARVAEALRDATKLRGDVHYCAPGSLPNDGRVIEDARRYE